MTSPFGKPNAKGRSTGVYPRRQKTLFGPPKDKSWVWQSVELLSSPAWKARGINTVRLIDFLMIEHRKGRGIENGKLCATYEQLREFGLTRNTIPKAIREAEFLGLIRVEHGGRWQMTNQPSLFRLTFYADHEGTHATNDWKAIDEKSIADWREIQRAKKQKPMSRSGSTVPPEVGLRAIKGGKAES